MEVDIVTRPAFAVLGIEGRGPGDQGLEWVRPLWEKAHSRVDEIRAQITGGAWGLMSAVDTHLAPWTEEGKYLAGWEVAPGTTAPAGWTLWEVPESTFVTISCTLALYADAYHYARHEFLPRKGYEQVGAAHEFYPPEFEDPETDLMYLYITVAKKRA
jgi:predicted transcriptional regulator YdeE